MPPTINPETDGAEQTVFKKKLQKLKQYKGKGTELITVYIPEKADRSSVMGQLTEELGQSSNIKSATTRKNVQGALRKIAGFLKNIDFRIPPKGIVVFCGNVSEVEGRSDIRLFTINPLHDLKTKLYWCDSTFHLAPLEEMIKPTDIYALLVLDKREATLALLTGKKYEILGHFTSAVAGKTRAGGQCLSPFTRVLLENGKKISLQQIQIGQKVKSAKLNGSTIISSPVAKKWNTTKQAIQIKTQNPKIEIISSLDHVFFTLGHKIKEKNVKELSLNDQLLVFSENKIRPVQINSIQSLNKKIPMIDITIKNKNFFANNILVHNSSVRFEHLREEAAKDFFRRVSEKINQLLVEYEGKLRGIIIGGPGMTKHDFLKQSILDYRLKDRILGMIDNSYTDESGIRELMQRSEDILKDTAIMRERQIVNRFLEEAVKDGLATYGQKEVEKALEIGQASEIILSEGINWLVIKIHCDKCSYNEEKVIKEPEKYSPSDQECSQCHSSVEILEEVDYVDWILEKAHAKQTKVHVVSTETSEGQTFYRGFGGIGCLLRYKL